MVAVDGSDERRRVARVAAWLVGTIACACAPALGRPFTPPEDGGPPWTELTSRHFVVRTDLTETQGQEVVAALEQGYGLLADVAFPFEARPDGRTVVLVTRSREEYELLAPPGTAGFFRRQLDPALPSLHFYGGPTEAAQVTMLHELAHRFTNFYYPGAPRWVHEGLAEYYSTAVLAGGKALFGRHPPGLRFRPGMLWDQQQTAKGAIVWVPTGSVPIVETMIATSPRDFSGRADQPGEEQSEARRVIANYAGAWALVHFLKSTSTYESRFASFLSALGAGESPEQAWQAGFGTVARTELEAEFQRYLNDRTHMVLRTDYVPPAQPPAAARTMTADEVHLLWAAIRPWTDAAALRQARADVGAALAIAPRSADARLWLARLEVAEGKPAEAERNLRLALELRPDDERALLELFRLYDAQLDVGADGQRDFGRTDALLPALQRSATLSLTHNAVAWHLAWERGRLDEALPYASTAVRDFSCFECFDTLAFVMAKKGAFSQAFKMQSIALNTMPDGYFDADVLARWESYRQAATAGK
ncbi:hypothetical protein [Nannocystis punicea]|uniref:DUF1570 domain-containing protein n=1 Tax=Nannocystis punicea TaxID=2995304 RepID=A0ABY7H7E2_9BACT|nr:hypothetical protein [Nannocystis poenicansa]WAS95172.1 hypothetical protein O0S08_03335 [Nannocystis poenicansa]